MLVGDPSFILLSPLTLFADAPTRLKKELNIILTLQADIDTIERTLQNTRKTILHGEAPKDSLTTIMTMEQT